MVEKVEKGKARYQKWKQGRKEAMNTKWEKLRDDPEFWEQFLAQISERGRLRAHLTMWEIPFSSYYRWIRQNPARQADVSAALEAAGHGYAEQSADDIDAFDMSDPRFARLRLEQQRWFAARYAPDVYGDKQKLEVEHSTKQQDHLAALKELSRMKQVQHVKVINPTGDEDDDDEA